MRFEWCFMACDFAFLDSGTGGIPYMLDLKRKSPESRCLYLGDTEHFPYGEKTSSLITECASEAINRILESWSPRTIVIACNTISVTALEELRERFSDIPIVGTVPAIKVAANVTRNRRIGLLATAATVSHPYCLRLIEDFASGCTVIKRADPELISFIEHDLFTAGIEERRAAVKPSVDFFKDSGCDTIVLGCTHFTHVADDVSFVAGDGITVVDSRDGVANQALRVEKEFILRSGGLKKTQAEEKSLPPDQSFFVTSLKSAAEDLEYSSLCRRFGIPWGGLLPA